MPQESRYGDFSSRVFPNNTGIVLCAQPVSIGVSSSPLTGVRRTCPRILPPRDALANIYEAWQKDGRRCVALRVVSRVLLQILAGRLRPVSGEE